MVKLTTLELFRHRVSTHKRKNTSLDFRTRVHSFDSYKQATKKVLPSFASFSFSFLKVFCATPHFWCLKSPFPTPVSSQLSKSTDKAVIGSAKCKRFRQLIWHSRYSRTFSVFLLTKVLSTSWNHWCFEPRRVRTLGKFCLETYSGDLFPTVSNVFPSFRQTQRLVDQVVAQFRKTISNSDGVKLRATYQPMRRSTILYPFRIWATMTTRYSSDKPASSRPCHKRYGA